jgi:hypothetical protein
MQVNAVAEYTPYCGCHITICLSRINISKISNKYMICKTKCPSFYEHQTRLVRTVMNLINCKCMTVERQCISIQAFAMHLVRG